MVPYGENCVVCFLQGHLMDLFKKFGYQRWNEVIARFNGKFPYYHSPKYSFTDISETVGHRPKRSSIWTLRALFNINNVNLTNSGYLTQNSPIITHLNRPSQISLKRLVVQQNGAQFGPQGLCSMVLNVNLTNCGYQTQNSPIITHPYLWSRIWLVLEQLSSNLGMWQFMALWLNICSLYL